MTISKSGEKTVFYCTECGSESPKWSGQCSGCGEWNTLQEHRVQKTHATARFSGFAPKSEVLNLSDIDVEDAQRIPTGSGEFDRVLGGGLVPGSVILIGGDPGIGKSTLLLQQLSSLSAVPSSSATPTRPSTTSTPSPKPIALSIWLSSPTSSTKRLSPSPR